MNNNLVHVFLLLILMHEAKKSKELYNTTKKHFPQKIYINLSNETVIIPLIVYFLECGWNLSEDIEFIRIGPAELLCYIEEIQECTLPSLNTIVKSRNFQ